MNNVVVTETEKFTKYTSNDKNFVVTNGYLTGDEIIVPVTAGVPKESFALIPVDLLPNAEYFETNSEYADGGIWNSVQNKGERKDYSYAFTIWGNSAMIFPKYPLRDIDKCMYALKDCSGLVDGRNLVFHITNDNPNMMYVCANCSNMAYAPRFVFYNAPIVKNYMSMYAGCLKLEEVYIYWGNGSTDPISERNSCQNTFFKCANLKDIHFTGKGSPIHLDLSYSKYITYSTLLSLADSLMVIDVTEAANKYSKHEIMISTTTAAMLRGEIAVTHEDIQIEGVDNYSEQPNIENARQIIPYLESMEYITNLTFDLEIIPKEAQSTDQEFYVQLYRNSDEQVFFTTTPNVLKQTVSFPMMTEEVIDTNSWWSKKFNKEEISNGILLDLVNFTAPCDIKITNLRFNYCDNSGLFTSKGWTIIEQERADSVIM